MDPKVTLKFMHDLLRALNARKGSELLITPGSPIAMKVGDRVAPIVEQSTTPLQSREMARAIMTDEQAAQFEAASECSFTISPAGIGRFRVKASVQQGSVALVLSPTTSTMID